MSLFDDLVEALPELTINDFRPFEGSIVLRDDGDGAGPYIEKWEYSKPIPKGFQLGKPTAQHNLYRLFQALGLPSLNPFGIGLS